MRSPLQLTVLALLVGTLSDPAALSAQQRPALVAGLRPSVVLVDNQHDATLESMGFQVSAYVGRPFAADFAGLLELGVTTADILGAEVPVLGMAGDQQAATVGQACIKPGMIKATYGTGCFALLNTGDRPVVSSHGLLTTVAWRIGGRTTYALEGAVFVAGAAVQWLRDGLGIIANAAETDALARSVPDAGGVYFVPAFVGLGAPYWDQHARGTILGLTRGTTRAHLARAALEAIAFQSRDVLEAMAADAKATLPRLRVDGGAVANHFLCQFQADVLDAPVDRPAVIETTGLGAAYLAGLGVGLWRSLDAVAERHAVERTFTPAMAGDERAARYETWKRAVERARAWAT